ncbi:MAG: peptidoglycan-binding protein [Candidatus Acidiferrum sp.]
MRWPNFRDYQPSLQKFYEPVNYTPAWVKGSSPSSQALAMIELLRNAWKKGLEPEDYDASRWDSRLHAMQGSAADPAALVRYTELARADDGEQLPVPAKPVDPGQSYPDAARLVRILQLLGDLPTDTARPTDSPLYDGTLAEAVKRFQRRHGPDADGRLGPAAVNQLNVPLTDRVRQLQLTLERWRWLPTEYSAPPIIVNIPDFRLRALDENKRIALETRVVVGTMRSETPVFWRDMTYLVLRPYWNVPPGILRKDVIPAIKRDRSQVATKNYEITTLNGKLITSGAVSDEVLAELQAGKPPGIVLPHSIASLPNNLEGHFPGSEALISFLQLVNHLRWSHAVALFFC